MYSIIISQTEIPQIIFLLFQDKERLRMEISGLRNRVDQAEKELVESKEECIKLTREMQSLEREVL